MQPVRAKAQSSRPTSNPPPNPAEQVAAAIRQFFEESETPVLIEPGDDPVAVNEDNLTLEQRGHRLMLECCSSDPDSRQGVLVRKVTGVRKQRRGYLELVTERFGGKPGTLQLLDVSHPGRQHNLRRGEQWKFREEFGLALRRQFPDWKLAQLTTETDLEHSLSPAYPRALLVKGRMGIAAIGAGPECLDPDGVLSFGLIWLDYLRRREPRLVVGGLVVFVPIGAESVTCHRVRHLDPEKVRCEVFVYGDGAREERIDPADYTNLATRLEPFRAPLAGAPLKWVAQVDRLSALEGVSRVAKPDGSVSLRVRGTEFAALRHDPAKAWQLTYGLHGRREAKPGSEETIVRLARKLNRERHPDAKNRKSRLYTRQPEAWLESEIRRAPAEIDASLEHSPLYTQAPWMVGTHRSVLDLIGADLGEAPARRGQLVVIEVKASEDIHLPLQALDYWMRVAWHVERGEFQSGGYFPGIELSRVPPRLILAAPALDYHPTNDTILGFLAPEIEVARVGVGIEWRRGIRVMFRR